MESVCRASFRHPPAVTLKRESANYTVAGYMQYPNEPLPLVSSQPFSCASK